MTIIGMREHDKADKTVNSTAAMKLDPAFSDLIEWGQ